MQFNYAPPKTKTQINTQVVQQIDLLIAARLSALEIKLAGTTGILDGVSLEELTNFAVPLTGNQTEQQKRDGILLGYKDGKLVEETDLNGGTF